MYKHSARQGPSFAKTTHMKKLQLYIATSLDGYVARPDGSLDWLTQFPNPDQLDYGYPEFYAGIDTVVMGRKTYEEILGFDVPWPYADCTSYVVSSNADLPLKTEDTKLLGGNFAEALKEEKTKDGKNIWLVGGGGLVKACMEHELVDELIWTIIPVVLGEGIPLFPKGVKETSFKLTKAEGLSTGAVMLWYARA